MNDWYFDNRHKSLDEVTANVTATRHDWRKPRLDEAKPDAAGNIILAMRDETRRVRCVGSAYNSQFRILFSVWLRETRATEEDEWTEGTRFPQAHQIKSDKRGKWGCLDLAITTASNEWRMLAPAPLRDLLAAQ